MVTGRGIPGGYPDHLDAPIGLKNYLFRPMIEARNISLAFGDRELLN